MKDPGAASRVESGWYHEARQAFVPGSRGEGFCLFAGVEKLPREQSFDPLMGDGPGGKGTSPEGF